MGILFLYSYISISLYLYIPLSQCITYSYLLCICNSVIVCLYTITESDCPLSACHKKYIYNVLPIKCLINDRFRA